MRLGFWVSIGVLLQWVAVAALGGVGFVFRWCFVVVVLWQCWVSYGGAVVVCNDNTKQL